MYEHMLFTLFFYRQTVPMLRVTTHDVGFEMFFLLFKILFWTFQVIKNDFYLVNSKWTPPSPKLHT